MTNLEWRSIVENLGPGAKLSVWWNRTRSPSPLILRPIGSINSLDVIFRFRQKDFSLAPMKTVHVCATELLLCCDLRCVVFTSTAKTEFTIDLYPMLSMAKIGPCFADILFPIEVRPKPTQPFSVSCLHSTTTTDLGGVARSRILTTSNGRIRNLRYVSSVAFLDFESRPMTFV
jgi:hypothetical protein